MEISKILAVFILALAPSIEARYALIAGIAMGMDKFSLLILLTLSIFTLSALLTLTMNFIDKVLQKTCDYDNILMKTVCSSYHRYVLNLRKRVEPYVKRYGLPGLALFVAIPLPATGIWTGALAAYLLGLKPKHTFAALVIGGMASMLIVYAGAEFPQLLGLYT